MTPFEIGIIFAAMAGWAAFFYIIYKSKMDKPKLEFDEGLKIFYPAEGGNNFTTIVIRMKVHNRGTKPTTIHHSKLTFNYNSEPKEKEDDRISLEILPDRTEDFSPSLNLHKDDFIIHGKITNCKLMVKHTHGKKVIDLGTIEENKK